MVAAAVIGAAVVGGVATSVASSNAASATTSATNASIAAQQTAQQQQQALNAPYANIGTGSGGNSGAIQQYQNLLGLGPQGAAGEQAALAATPGYQFSLNQGLQATTNAATLTNPGAISGNTLEALDKYSTGLADQTYQNAVGNAQNAVTIGQNAAAGTGSGILQTASNVSNSLTNQGNTTASIDANTAASYSKLASGAVSNYATLANLNTQPSDPAAGLGG